MEKSYSESYANPPGDDTPINRKFPTRAAMPPDNAARSLYRSVGSLTRPVTTRS